MGFIVSTKGLNPYSGSFGSTEFKHLYRRTHFGINQQIIQSGQALTLSQCLNSYLVASPAPAPPVNYYQSLKGDPTVPLGQTWVNAPSDGNVNNFRTNSFRYWLIANMLDDNTITEKMTLFLHSFLPINTDVGDPRYLYNNYMMLRNNCLGNFKTIIKSLSIDPGMLRFLNGYLNQKNAPDENYARELMELFTLGKGYNPIYSETDIQQAAKVLTGYQIDVNTATYKFTPSRHSSDNKTFSSFFNNKVINGVSGAAGEGELDELINMIFLKDEVALYFCRKLYKFFVYYEIDDSVETNVIKPLAALMRSSNYEILPVIRTLLESEHFYDSYTLGSHIKSPTDMVLGYVKEVGLPLPSSTNYQQYYEVLGEFANFNAGLGQDVFNPPSVSGWEAYYQFPNYHENWINTDTIQNRFKIPVYILIGYNRSGFRIQPDVVLLTKGFQNPEDPNKLINNALDYFHVIKNPTDRDTYATDLKKILLFGQSQDYYWTDAWNAHIANPSDAAKKKTVTDLLTIFYKHIFELAEYQLL